jgi:putative lipoprotein
MAFRSLLVLFSILFLSACQASKSTTPTASLRNTRWVLQTLAATPISTPENNQEIYLQFNATTDQVAGFAGCNRFFGRFEQPTPNTLRLLGVGSTKMFCEARQHVETDYLNALQRVARYEIQGNTLRLYPAAAQAEPLAVFKAVYF